MNEHARKVIATLALLSFVASSGCTATIQIGGKQNSSEQNRQAPVSNRSEVAMATPQPASSQPQPIVAEVEQQPEPEVVNERQSVVVEEPDTLRQQQNDLAAERLRIERARLENDRREVEQQRQEQEARQAQIQANLREQQLILEEKTRAANQRLAEMRQPAIGATQPPYVYTPVERLPSVNPNPIQLRTSGRTQGLIVPSVVYASQKERDKIDKKGHSTRNKVIAGALIGGGAVLGIVLSRRH